MNKTVNRQFIGGSISNTNGLQHILSIGYEMEAGNLMKLNRLESDELVLFNSDTNLNNMDFGGEFDEDENTLMRTQEVIEMDVISSNGKPDENASFSITNDIALYPFAKKLMKSCYYPSQDVIKSKSKSMMASEKDHSKEKNELYVFKDLETNKEYKIHFLFKSNRECYEQSNVEWIFTYYKPKRQINVVVNTFLNMIQNLVKHVKDLEPIKGNFIFKYKDADNNTQELIIDKPKERILFHKPGTNLYYLQNHIADKEFNIDGTCMKIQMTFSAKAEHITTILETIYAEKKPSIPTLSEKLKSRLENVKRIRKCVDALIEGYNKSDAQHKLVEKKKKDPAIDILKNYLFLILYKIERYYYFKKAPGKQTKYFKDILPVNCRHGNYELYSELKKHIQIAFGVDAADAITIIKAVVLQPETMNTMVIPEIQDKLRKGVFSASNMLEKTNSHYGDPIYSLCSYFDFFENPLTDDVPKTLSSGESNLTSNEETDDTYDWLEYQEIDVNSTRMALKDGIVLIECRNFQDLISMFAYTIADKELKEQMKNGACNIITNHYSEDVQALSIGNFKKIIEIMKLKKARKTQKKTGTKSK